MALHGGIDGSDPIRSEPVARSAGPEEVRRRARSSRLGTGTLACPRCDAPVAPAAGPRSPAEPLACPFCHHAAALRDFLSLADPTRPARVEVRVVHSPDGDRHHGAPGGGGAVPDRDRGRPGDPGRAGP